MNTVSKETSVKVGVRIRPLFVSESHDGSSRCLRSDINGNQINIGHDNSFTFDNVFPEESSQEEIYDACVLPLVGAFFEGFNATVLAYGQTASGKTYTMGSASNLHLPEKEYGIIPRVVNDIFQNIKRSESSDDNSTYCIRIQYLELYGEEMKDLLNPLNTVRIAIRETVSGEMYLSGVREEQVSSAEEVLRLLEKGSMSRTTGSTRMNQSSSRSHAIFSVILEHSIHLPAEPGQVPTTMNLDGPEVRKCKFHFVDLAGSERAKRTGAQGLRMKEGIDINKGLLVLGNVISALGEEQRRAHVPYRDSKLTRLLQDSLGGNSKTVMLCCVSPSDVDFNETLNAVRYANRARNIQNKPVVNVDPTSLLIAELRRQIKMLATDLLASRQQSQRDLTFSEEELKVMSLGGAHISKNVALSSAVLPPERVTAHSRDLAPRIDRGNVPALPSNSSFAKIKLEEEIMTLKERDRANCSSLNFYTAKCDRLQSQLSEHTEELIRAKSERDFYLLKCGAGNDVGATDGSHMDVIGGYIREISRLNAVISGLQLRHLEEGAQFFNEEGILETELSSNIAKLFTSTERQLRSDKNILHRIESRLSDDESDASDTEKEQPEELFEVQDKLYQHRAKLMTTEVLDISESIHFKEELIHQLHQSQKQYEAMKAFYESKLEVLCEEMAAKEVEKQKVVDELNCSLSHQHSNEEDENTRKEREEKLKKMLHKKEMELKVMKTRQQELTNLSRVQSRSFDQIKRLEVDILQLKKQRVSLAKSLQQEKKIFMRSLHMKAKEIDRLKRELALAMTKMSKLGKEKERSTETVNRMIKVESTRRKKAAEMQRELMSHRSKPSRGKGLNSQSLTPRSTRSMLQSLIQTSHKTGHLPTLDEQKTRSWIEANVLLLVQREEAVADLTRQCEQQLVLLHQKKDLEDSRQSLVAEKGGAADISEVEDSIQKVANQLKFRNTEIAQKKREVDDGDGNCLSSEQIVQHLCASVGSSPSEVQSALRVLFGLFLSNQKISSATAQKLRESQESQRAQQVALDDTVDKLNLQSSNYRREVARIEKEYQAKMMGLFDYSGFHELIQGENGSTLGVKDDRNSFKTSRSGRNGDNARLEEAFGTGSPGRYSSDGLRAVAAVAEERYTTLQSQLKHEEMRVHELESFADECNIERRHIHEKYDAKCQENSFLEEECRMLRAIVCDLKAGHAGAVDGNPLTASPHPVSRNLSDNFNDFDEETESVLGEYSDLRAEIISTGSVLVGDSIFDRLTNPSNFTGTQKNIFKKDVEVNRAKVQQRKGGGGSIIKKDRKRKDEHPPHDWGEAEGSGGYQEHPTLTQLQQEEILTASSSAGDCDDTDRGVTPPKSPCSKKSTHSSPFRSPGDLSENVFSRLLNPSRYTGIHRRHLDSSTEVIAEERQTLEHSGRLSKKQ